VSAVGFALIPEALNLRYVGFVCFLQISVWSLLELPDSFWFGSDSYWNCLIPADLNMGLFEFVWFLQIYVWASLDSLHVFRFEWRRTGFPVPLQPPYGWLPQVDGAISAISPPVPPPSSRCAGSGTGATLWLASRARARPSRRRVPARWVVPGDWVSEGASCPEQAASWSVCAERYRMWRSWFW
jgi:hypothetical protein